MRVASISLFVWCLLLQIVLGEIITVQEKEFAAFVKKKKKYLKDLSKALLKIKEYGDEPGAAWESVNLPPGEDTLNEFSNTLRNIFNDMVLTTKTVVRLLAEHPEQSEKDGLIPQTPEILAALGLWAVEVPTQKVRVPVDAWPGLERHTNLGPELSDDADSPFVERSAFGCAWLLSLYCHLTEQENLKKSMNLAQWLYGADGWRAQAFTNDGNGLIEIDIDAPRLKLLAASAVTAGLRDIAFKGGLAIGAVKSLAAPRPPSVFQTNGKSSVDKVEEYFQLWIGAFEDMKTALENLHVYEHCKPGECGMF